MIPTTMESWVKTPVTRCKEGLKITVQWNALTDFASNPCRGYFCDEYWGQAYANTGSDTNQ